MKVILCIVGSVSLAGNKKALEIIRQVIRHYKPSKIISGEAVGVDTMAEIEANRQGIPFEGFPPKERNWERGYKPRNLAMAETCTHLVRIVSSKSTTFGSGWTRDKALELGKVVSEFVVQE